MADSVDWWFLVLSLLGLVTVGNLNVTISMKVAVLTNVLMCVWLLLINY